MEEKGKEYRKWTITPETEQKAKMSGPSCSSVGGCGAEKGTLGQVPYSMIACVFRNS